MANSYSLHSPVACLPCWWVKTNVNKEGLCLQLLKLFVYLAEKLVLGQYKIEAFCVIWSRLLPLLSVRLKRAGKLYFHSPISIFRNPVSAKLKFSRVRVIYLYSIFWACRDFFHSFPSAPSCCVGHPSGSSCCCCRGLSQESDVCFTDPSEARQVGSLLEHPSVRFTCEKLSTWPLLSKPRLLASVKHTSVLCSPGPSRRSTSMSLFETMCWSSLEVSSPIPPWKMSRMACDWRVSAITITTLWTVYNKTRMTFYINH